MNRSRRRAVQRRVLRAARDHGCTCTPEVIADVLPTVAGPGGWVLHEAGCPLGDAVARCNEIGVAPVLFVQQSPECRR